MLHAQQHPHAARRSVGRITLPALLLALGGGALAGLATQSAGAAPTLLAGPTANTVVEGLATNPEQRASRARSRSVEAAAEVAPGPEQVVAAPPAPAAALPPPPPPPPPPPVAAPPVAAPPLPPPAPAPKAKPAPAKVVSSGTCPVPSASFTDTWGAPRSGGRSHKGTDMLASSGAPAYAVADGVVRTSSGGAGGIALYLRAINGDVFYYAHNSSNVARNGERVKAGQLIARVGSSGNASGGVPHVHFEIQPGGGASVNPYRFLRGIC